MKNYGTTRTRDGKVKVNHRKECWEDNAGGITIIWRDSDGKITAAAWGLEYQTDGDGNYDMRDWDDYADCTGTSCGWVDTDNNAGVVSVDTIQQDINRYEPTGNMCLIAVTQDDVLITYPDAMGYSGKKYFRI